jgi:hypothetical protein
MLLPKILLILTIPTTIFACSIDGKTGFLPPNDIEIPPHQKAGLSIQEFHEVIDQVEAIYNPIVTSHGSALKIQRMWENPRVNAGTLQLENGKVWQINLYGGFARHPSLTPDGFALVICHELGHHLGGAPKKKIPTWSSFEGQSDYFATLKCLRLVFQKQDNIAAIAEMDIPSKVSQRCTSSFSVEWEAALCIRTTMAGLSVASVSADIQKEPIPSTDRFDATIVEESQEKHPLAQCRLDSYFEGSVCEVSSYVKVSQIDEVPGTCHPASGHTTGTRPLCWFKPRLK